MNNDHADTIFLNFKCAVAGASFRAEYERVGNLYAFRKSTLITEAEPGDATSVDGSSGAGENPLDLASNHLSHTGFYCPSCGDKGEVGSFFFKCGTCAGLVCAGNSERVEGRVVPPRRAGIRFQCAASCGGSGHIAHNSSGISKYTAQRGRGELLGKPLLERLAPKKIHIQTISKTTILALIKKD